MRSYLYLLIISLLAFFILFIVFHFGDIPNRYNNGFKRKYLPVSARTHELHLPDTLYEIAGLTASTIYIATAKEGEVLEVNTNLSNGIRRIKIPFFSRVYDSLQITSLAVQIDSPYIYLFAESTPAIIKTAFDSSLFEIKILPPGSFSREVKVGAGCFILRKFESRLTDQIFVRYDFNTGLLRKEDGISQIYGDGGIISDGQLHFDAETKKLCYIYYYKNLLLSFDTSLSNADRFFTIDTMRSFKMKTGKVKNSGTEAYTNITPSNVINKVNDVKNGLLFNMSALKADNESDKFFSENSIIDIVDLRNGQYLGSIYLPVFNGSKLERFVISNNRLIGLYKNSIVTYELKPALNLRDQ